MKQGGRGEEDKKLLKIDKAFREPGLTEELVDPKNIFRGVVLKLRGYHLYYKTANLKKKKKGPGEK